jgi:hypothetical protein
MQECSRSYAVCKALPQSAGLFGLQEQKMRHPPDIQTDAACFSQGGVILFLNGVSKKTG